jgi:hypothetical protein
MPLKSRSQEDLLADSRDDAAVAMAMTSLLLLRPEGSITMSGAESVDGETSGHMAPTVVQPLTSVTVEYGHSAVLTCTVCGRPSLTVLWTKHGGQKITTEHDDRITVEYNEQSGIARLQLSCVVASDNGDYTLTATNSLGSTSTSATLTVLHGMNDSLLQQSMTAAVAKSLVDQSLGPHRLSPDNNTTSSTSQNIHLPSNLSSSDV